MKHADLKIGELYWDIVEREIIVYSRFYNKKDDTHPYKFTPYDHNRYSHRLYTKKGVLNDVRPLSPLHKALYGIE